jgi:hypothetical protein
MPSFDVAHIRRQGIDLILILVNRNFASKMQREQHAAIAELQSRTTAAGLAGRVIPVWDAGGGRMQFLAHRDFHPFLRSLSLAFVARNINRKLSW